MRPYKSNTLKQLPVICILLVSQIQFSVCKGNDTNLASLTKTPEFCLESDHSIPKACPSTYGWTLHGESYSHSEKSLFEKVMAPDLANLACLLESHHFALSKLVLPREFCAANILQEVPLVLQPGASFFHVRAPNCTGVVLQGPKLYPARFISHQSTRIFL